MKPGEVVIRSFDLRSSTEQGEKYRCEGGLEIVVEFVQKKKYYCIRT